MRRLRKYIIFCSHCAFTGLGFRGAEFFDMIYFFADDHYGTHAGRCLYGQLPMELCDRVVFTENDWDPSCVSCSFDFIMRK